MRTKLFTFGMLVSFSVCVFAQEEWEPKKKVTGYIALEGDYFSGLKYYDREYAIAIPEAGLLASYNPIEKLTIKAVFIYRPKYEIDQMLNEINAEYKFTDYLNVKAGRFIVPLSPVNTYYYAPVNNSATLPMLIQNHEFFPLNIDGLSLNGKIGNDFKVNYDLFGGGFRNSLYLRTGALEFFGDENTYFQRVNSNDTSANQDAASANVDWQIGGGAHAGISYKDFITVGFNLFKSEEIFAFEGLDYITGNMITTRVTLNKLSYGFNLKLNISSFALLGEYWTTTVKTDFFELDYKGAFVEASYNFGKLTPYIRYEYHDVPMVPTGTVDYYRYTGGINYKPLFETTFKLEYIHYKYQSLDLDGVVGTVIYSF